MSGCKRQNASILSRRNATGRAIFAASPHFLALSDKALRIINQNMLCGFVFNGA
jgi:hypothetical protein